MWISQDFPTLRYPSDLLQTENPKEDIFKALVASAKSKGLSNTEYQFLNGDAVVGLVAGR